MADEQLLAILRQGSDVWNAWRRQNAKIRPNLTGAVLAGAGLRAVNLSETDLTEADLSHTDLSFANLRSAILTHADLVATDFTCADLFKVFFIEANIEGANFSSASLYEADLTDSDLTFANLSNVDLTGANFTNAILKVTVLGDVDLSGAKGLDTCRHKGPSIIDYRTLQRSGQLPLSFLRGCGLPDNLIDYLPSLLNQPIQFYSCFISYSSKDDEFARRLHADLQDNGTRCWFAPEDMKIGDHIRTKIDEVIRLHEKLLLVLSANSIDSDWVEKEVETAFEKERETKSTVLFPIRLDDAVMESKAGWAADIKRSRHIGDFRHWKDHDGYHQAFERLLRDLKVEAGRT